ncbi:sugar phosphate isomerase/epimerase family protein [Oceanitalea stevensii]|uniref:Sugar phosphate isomerase/epimerase n=1 Tax=Oceanitalea stevensii TaxID=2763072 RepID=A0ABR8Z0Q4_9MICO|nr:sugar phosphate isomerase/epimerase family protein [Oceanitalea stevensii]MBD8061898.1 sugar phosphate isomerase/epimerase [Oceanitalea stevensii]
MWTLSGFSDEISPDFQEQCAVASRLGLRYIELRSAWGTNVLDLDDDQLATAARMLADHGLQVSSIGSPIGKVHLDDDAAAHLGRMRRAAHVAQTLGAPYIRIFSFFMRPGTDPDTCRDEVVDRLGELVDVVAGSDVTLVHENEKEIFGDVPRRCADMARALDSPHFGLAWDPANYVQVGVRPFTEAYELLRPHTRYVQIKDALRGSGTVVKAGEGDGEIAQTLSALRADGYDGFFSLEPHLAAGHSMGGFSGPELFGEALRAFTDLLDAEGVAYR